jgi:tripartite-type tricarboxylate transporter receptor subunit TctC
MTESSVMLAKAGIHGEVGNWILIFIRMTLAMGALTSASLHAASAPAYPTKTVRMVVNAAPGGANDVLGRMVAKVMTDALGHNVVVDNRAGAGGNVGAEIVAHAAPDGYTFLYCTSSVVVSPSLYPKLNYKLSELAPLTQAASFPQVIAVHPSLPAANLKELIAHSKKTGGVNYGSTGTGSMNHLTGVLLDSVAGTKNVHIGYKGAGPMMTALLSNEVPMGVGTVFSMAPHVKAGRLRALAVSSLKPVPALPGVPPVAAMFAGFETSLWHGYFTTAGTPQPIVALLNAEIVKALKSPMLSEAIENGGGITIASTPQAFAAAIRQDAEKYAKLVKISGATAE